MRMIVLMLLAVLVLYHSTCRAEAEQLVYEVMPSETDPAIRRFNEPHYVVFDPQARADAPLVVFMTGTNGEADRPKRLLNLVAGQGYRVISLQYNDTPAVDQICPRSPSPTCSGNFRERRIFGDNVTSVIDDTPAESIVNRLVRLLQYLHRQHPDQHWDGYLAGDEPAWNRIVVSGMSQGAGMAAYIAKRKPVVRVVLISSPWDFTGRQQALAPWLFEPSATPPERWFAEYHEREKFAALLVRSYTALKIPEENIRVFNLGLPPRHGDKNPYHGSLLRMPGYEPQWRFLFGHYP